MMRNGFERRRPLILVLTAVLSLGMGCTALGTGTLRGPADQVCPMFDGIPVTIDITDAAREFPLGGGSSLLVPANAVPRGQTRRYNVTPAVVGARKYAGFEFTPFGHAYTEFDETLQLRISYDKCDAIKRREDTDRFYIVKTKGSKRENQGGAKSKNSDYVSATIESFSKFAIAID